MPSFQHPAGAHASSPTIPIRAAYSIPEAAELLSISRAGLYRRQRDGEIEFIKFGGRTLVPAREIARLTAGGAA